jgi:hypothetical protein
MLALHVNGPALAFARQLHPTTTRRELMKTLVSVSIACCLGLAAAGVAAQEKKDAMKKEMTAADCKTYMDAAAKDAKMKDAAKDSQCKALADKEKAKK